MKREILFGLFVATMLASHQADAQDYGEVVYNRFNIHYFLTQNRRSQVIEKIASYANYVDPVTTGSGKLPYNTPVTLSKWGRRGFIVTMEDGKDKVFFEYRAANMGGMSQEEYIKLIFSKEKVSYPDLNAMDKEGVKAGAAQKGMTKAGVTVALGYPARHRTESLENDTWWFWKDRFRTMAVVFKDGKVEEIRE